MNTRALILDLYEIQAIKFGSFTLKSGIISPIYMDLRLIVSYPELLKSIGEALWQKIHLLSFDLICGVPYTALPIATCLCVQHDLPMIWTRKEVKDYGTKKTVEGVFRSGDTCLIIEDVITSGLSILETIEPLEKEGLVVKDVAVVINRGQGGQKRLSERGLNLHALFTLSELLTTLQETHKIDVATANTVNNFLQNV